MSALSPITGPFGRRSDIWPILSFLLAGALLIIPGAPTSQLGGTPLSNPARGVLVVLLIGGGWLLLFRTVRSSGGPWVSAALVVLCLVKAMCATLGAPSGWRVTYDMLDGTPARATFFWDFGAQPYRIEPEILLERTVPGMHFLNALRYTNGPYGLREKLLPCASRGPAPCSPPRLPRHRHPPCCPRAERFASWRTDASWACGQTRRRNHHPARHVRCTCRGGSDLRQARGRTAACHPELEHRGRQLPPAIAPDAAAFARAGWEPAARGITKAACAIGFGLFLIQILAGTFVWPLRPRADGSVVGALAMLAVAGSIAWHGHTVFKPFLIGGTYMSAGNDQLGYEGAARDIMEHGLLMNSGRPPGTGSAFGFYPLYPYVLAAVHWLIGDDGGAIFLANTAFVCSTLLLFWFIGWRRLPGPLAVIAALAFGAFLYRHAFVYTGEAFTDNLFLPMFFAALASVVWAVQTRTMAAGILAGVICALGAETRPSLLTLFPFLLPMLLFGLRDWTWALRGRLIVVLIVGFMLGVAPFALRNRIVSGQTAIVSSSWIQLPYPPRAHAEQDALARRFPKPPTPRESLTAVAEIVREHPWRSFTIEARKLLFTLGFTNLRAYRWPGAQAGVRAGDRAWASRADAARRAVARWRSLPWRSRSRTWRRC